MSTIWTPRVTVAAVVEQTGRYLLVEEHTTDGIRLNQPAGHLDQGETPDLGAIRETLEESAWSVEITGLLGLYLNRYTSSKNGEDITYIRIAYAATPIRHLPDLALDDGIIRALWLDYDEVQASLEQHRSPLVLQCIDDYRAVQAGTRPLLPIDWVFNHSSVLGHS